MSRIFPVRLLGLLPVLVLAAGVSAAEDERESAPAPPELMEEQLAESGHSVTIDGRKVDYTARAGTILLKKESGENRASIFYVAYTVEGERDPSSRPITFSFNGGPGSSSVWLHLGLLGPRRVELEEDGSAPPPPYRLVDNEFSLLDRSDLVFVDPVSTGYSRAAPGEEAASFHGLEEDIESVGEFIRIFLTRDGRWASPKFLIGESYGSTRAAGLAGYLQERHGMYLNGVMLVSSVLDFQSTRFDTGNDLPYVLFLPSYTATAWYHGMLDADLQGDLQRALEESRIFAGGSYARALFQGIALDPGERRAAVRDLARLTGLRPDYVEACDLRIHIFRFTKEILRARGLTAGRLDSRLTGRDRDDAGETPEFDPSYAAIHGPFTATLNDYLRGELKYETDLPYEILTGRVRPWKYGRYQNRYVNMAETLREAMTRNPHLRVLVACGYYDLATPFYASEYTFDHLGLDRDERDRVVLKYYESGHMMYIHGPSLEQQKRDLAEFIRSSIR